MGKMARRQEFEDFENKFKVSIYIYLDSRKKKKNIGVKPM